MDQSDHSPKARPAFAYYLVSVIGIGLLSICVGVTFCRGSNRPTAVEVFHRQKDAFERFVVDLANDRVKFDNENATYLVPSGLQGVGIGRVSVLNDCVVFYFAGLPPDQTEMIIFPRSGAFDLSSWIESRRPHRIVAFDSLGPNWIFVAEI